MNYKFSDKKDYHENKDEYIKLIEKMYEGDNNKLANLEEIKQHLEFIFSEQYANNSFLIFQKEDERLISMVNFFEYNNCSNEWCLFSLFTNQHYRKKGYGEKIMIYTLSKLKQYKCNKLIVGIEKENIPSIKPHEKIGFKYANCNWDDLAEGFPKNYLGFIYDVKM